MPGHPDSPACELTSSAESALPILVRAQQQDAGHERAEDEGAYVEGDGVGLGALVDAPGDDRHGNHPRQRDDEPTRAHQRQDAEDERHNRNQIHG